MIRVDDLIAELCELPAKVIGKNKQGIPGAGLPGPDGLRGVRAEGEEGAGGHERREQRGGGPEAEQGDGVGAGGGAGGGAAAGGEEGGAVAVHALRGGAAPLRARGLRQEGAAWLRAQRPRRPRQGTARQGPLHGGEVHHRVQRRQPKLVRRHVISRPLPSLSLCVRQDVRLCLCTVPKCFLAFALDSFEIFLWWQRQNELGMRCLLVSTWPSWIAEIKLPFVFVS